MTPADQCEAVSALVRCVTDEACMIRAVEQILVSARVKLSEEAADRVFAAAIDAARKLRVTEPIWRNRAHLAMK